MWNAGIPYVLKQLIDVISQPGWVFGVDPVTGYSHLLAGRGKRVAVVYTSAVWGPELGPDFGSDFQSTYFSDWLRWAGLTDISEIRSHPTLTGDREAIRAIAEATARDIAKTF
jgi:FMN-dependent NADH-azoreductase